MSGHNLYFATNQSLYATHSDIPFTLNTSLTGRLLGVTPGQVCELHCKYRNIFTIY